MFYPEDNGFEVNSAEWSAECAAVTRRYCLPCPVRLDCFAWAQEEEGDRSRGIWGGVHFVDRRRMKGLPVRCREELRNGEGEVVGLCGTILDPLIFLRTTETPLTCPTHTPTSPEDTDG